MEKPPNLPSGNLLQFAIEHGPVEIVDLPSSKMVVFHRFFVCLPWLVSNFWPSPMGCKLWGNAQAAQAQRFHPLDLGIPRYCHGSWEMLAVSHIIYIYIYIYIILHVIYIYIYIICYIYIYIYICYLCIYNYIYHSHSTYTTSIIINGENDKSNIMCVIHIYIYTYMILYDYICAYVSIGRCDTL